MSDVGGAKVESAYDVCGYNLALLPVLHSAGAQKRSHADGSGSKVGGGVAPERLSQELFGSKKGLCVEDEVIRKACLAANLEIVPAGLALRTRGNVSMADRDRGVMGIKPRGVSCGEMTSENLVKMHIMVKMDIYYVNKELSLRTLRESVAGVNVMVG